jgi:uncharacterized protein YqhQ
MDAPIRISSSSLEAAKRLRKRLGDVRSRLLVVDGEWVVELETHEPFDPEIITAVEAMAASERTEGDVFTLHVAAHSYRLGE